MKRGFTVVLALTVAAFTFIFAFIDSAAPALASSSAAGSAYGRIVCPRSACAPAKLHGPRTIYPDLSDICRNIQYVHM